MIKKLEKIIKNLSNKIYKRYKRVLGDENSTNVTLGILEKLWNYN